MLRSCSRRLHLRKVWEWGVSAGLAQTFCDRGAREPKRRPRGHWHLPGTRTAARPTHIHLAPCAHVVKPTPRIAAHQDPCARPGRLWAAQTTRYPRRMQWFCAGETEGVPQVLLHGRHAAGTRARPRSKHARGSSPPSTALPTSAEHHLIEGVGLLLLVSLKVLVFECARANAERTLGLVNPRGRRQCVVGPG